MTSEARGTLYEAIPALPKVHTTVAASPAACRTLSASSGPSQMMIGAPPSIFIALPAKTPREYLAMPLCSRFFPSGVSNTACTPRKSPSSL